MGTFDWATACLIFVVYVVIDMLYALYILCVGRHQALAAATISAVLYSLLAFGVVSYSKNILYLIPLASGAFLGTFITVKFKK
jgi:hypothetical protein